MDNTLWDKAKRTVKKYIHIHGEIDTESAAQRIRSGIWFRGANVWILAFSIIIASAGLNVNSTAVIIGAMLISPLMGPIIGTGLALGINDLELLRAALKNLLVMVVISLLASALFFLISPLALANPTELEARTSPTIYDVMIALFGGLAGILENSRKERGTVLSGVAIATALMPPLCTAGYGLAHWNMHFFFGALYLFLLNSIFIALATYLMVKYLRFKTVTGISLEVSRKQRGRISAILLVLLIPSIWSAVNLIRENNVQRNVRSFVEDHRLVAPHSYIYEYSVNGRHVTLDIAGEPLTDQQKEDYLLLAADYKLKSKDITLREHTFGMSQQDMNRIIEEIYTNTDMELSENDAQIASLQLRIDELAAQLDALRHQTDSLHRAPADTLELE